MTRLLRTVAVLSAAIVLLITAACTSELTTVAEAGREPDVAASPAVFGPGRAIGTMDTRETLPKLTPVPTVPAIAAGEPSINLGPPQSGPAIPRMWYEYHTDHCGVFSPIDFDGSYWLPVGISSDPHNDAGNPVPGRIGMVDSGTARFVSDNGVVVLLERHDSPTWFWLCQ